MSPQRTLPFGLSPWASLTRPLNDTVGPCGANLSRTGHHDRESQLCRLGSTGSASHRTAVTDRSPIRRRSSANSYARAPIVAVIAVVHRIDRPANHNTATWPYAASAINARCADGGIRGGNVCAEKRKTDQRHRCNLRHNNLHIRCDGWTRGVGRGSRRLGNRGASGERRCQTRRHRAPPNALPTLNVTGSSSRRANPHVWVWPWLTREREASESRIEETFGRTMTAADRSLTALVVE